MAELITKKRFIEVMQFQLEDNQRLLSFAEHVLKEAEKLGDGKKKLTKKIRTSWWTSVPQCIICENKEKNGNTVVLHNFILSTTNWNCDYYGYYSSSIKLDFSTFTTSQGKFLYTLFKIKLTEQIKIVISRINTIKDCMENLDEYLNLLKEFNDMAAKMLIKEDKTFKVPYPIRRYIDWNLLGNDLFIGINDI